jgi:hypothetical protein
MHFSTDKHIALHPPESQLKADGTLTFGNWGEFNKGTVYCYVGSVSKYNKRGCTSHRSNILPTLAPNQGYCSPKRELSRKVQMNHVLYRDAAISFISHHSSKREKGIKYLDCIVFLPFLPQSSGSNLRPFTC